MTKRLVDIDDDLLEQARLQLGTKTLKDTVNAALQETVQAARRRTITHEDLRIFADAARDLGDPQVMAKAWE